MTAGRSLGGKHALVTGGGRGIGRGIALAMAEAGAPVTIADRDADVAESTARELPADSAVAMTMNVADRASVEAGLDRAEAAFGPVDVVVANAGILKFAPFLELSTADWQEHHAHPRSLESRSHKTRSPRRSPLMARSSVLASEVRIAWRHFDAFFCNCAPPPQLAERLPSAALGFGERN
jgi:enoyl-[acyl-carrier-protein] reductase (NADH)